MKLEGKCALVTGAGSGIGQAIAAAYAREGARIIALDLDAAAAQRAADRAMDLGGTGRACAADLRDEDAVDAALAQVFATERVDVLVNSAGIAATASFLETGTALFDAMYAVNLRGTFLVAQRVARHMRDGGIRGCIINVGSVSGSRANAGRAAYGPMKAGVALLTQVMAVELGPLGIRVNALAPGPIETPLVAQAHSRSVRAEWLNVLPAARYGDPAEVAAAAVFLASADAGCVNGHILNVDGGFMAGGILR